MVKHGFKKMLAEAAAVVESISVHAAAQGMNEQDVVFVDVRGTAEREKAGRIPGAVHAPREFIEFIADPEGPMHDQVFASGKKLIVFCATGGRSMLTAKALTDMGIENVVTMTGGFDAWREAKAPTETGQ